MVLDSSLERPAEWTRHLLVLALIGGLTSACGKSGQAKHDAATRAPTVDATASPTIDAGPTVEIDTAQLHVAIFPADQLYGCVSVTLSIGHMPGGSFDSGAGLPVLSAEQGAAMRERHTERTVLGLVPAHRREDDETSLREEIERREVFREEQRVPQGCDDRRGSEPRRAPLRWPMEKADAA